MGVCSLIGGWCSVGLRVGVRHFKLRIMCYVGWFCIVHIRGFGWCWVVVGVCGAIVVVYGGDVEGVCDWRWVPCFALEYVELFALLD